MKLQSKHLLSAMCLVCMIIANQAYAINLLNIGLKAMLLSAGTIAANSNVKYPLALMSAEEVRRCPERNSMKRVFRAEIACNLPLSTREEAFCDNSDDVPNSFIEVCYKGEEACVCTVYIDKGFISNIESYTSNLDSSTCENPYFSPKSISANNVLESNYVFSDNTCSSEGQMFANSYSASTFPRCECDAGNGYKSIDEVRLSSSNVLMDDDGDCYLRVIYPNLINITEPVTTTTEPVTTTTEPVTTTTEPAAKTKYTVNITDAFIYDKCIIGQKMEEYWNDVLPPLLIISYGAPILVIIPMCIFEYKVMKLKSEPKQEKIKTLQACFITKSGSKVFFDVTIAVSNVRGQLVIEGTSASKNDQNSQSLWKKLLSKYWGASEGQQAISVVSKQLIPINELGEIFIQQYLKQPVTVDVDSEDVFEDAVEYICEYTREVTIKKKEKVNHGLTIVEQHQPSESQLENLNDQVSNLNLMDSQYKIP